MTFAGVEPRLDEFGWPVEKSEADASEPLAQEIPIASLQRRACDHHRPSWLGERGFGDGSKATASAAHR